MKEPQLVPEGNNMGKCACRDEYSFEPHGNGYALYFARCEHRHGYNLANITEPDLERLKAMVELLNSIPLILESIPKKPTAPQPEQPS